MANEFDGRAITSLNGTLNIPDGRILFDGKNALYLTIGDIGVGEGVLEDLTTGVNNCGFGRFSLNTNTTGQSNSSFGRSSLNTNTTGDFNSAFGVSALGLKQDTSPNTDLDNCTGLGNQSRASASNQVQLGNSSTTTFAYGAVQDRSDARDKADIADSPLGLDFVNKLRPVSFRWDMRDDYTGVNDKGETVRIEKDGSKKRSRLHYGVIAQELKAVMDEVGVDFGGYQDHSKSEGGCDVLSVGYTEFIGPLIKAVQELSSQVEDLKLKLKA